jgi:hypothetical protein
MLFQDEIEYSLWRSQTLVLDDVKREKARLWSGDRVTMQPLIGQKWRVSKLESSALNLNGTSVILRNTTQNWRRHRNDGEIIT